jgi:UDP-glucose 6-dehydrogenase
MGNHHFQVPGPDGQRGFGGPCLPKDTAALAYEYDIKLLKEVLNLNLEHRHGSN